VKALVTFEKDYIFNIVNLSRIDPSLLISKKTPGQTKGGPLVFIRDCKTPALCVTLGIIADDQTVTPRQRGDKEVKFITAKLLAYEYEQMVAVLCMVFGKKSVRVQLADSTLTFATRSAGKHFLTSCLHSNTYPIYQSQIQVLLLSKDSQRFVAEQL
jgi:hypothetical protein